jgi:hypothetical protein
MAQPVQSVAVEGMEVGPDRVGMEGEEASDGGRIPSLGVQQHRLGVA